VVTGIVVDCIWAGGLLSVFIFMFKEGMRTFAGLLNRLDIARCGVPRGRLSPQLVWRKISQGQDWISLVFISFGRISSRWLRGSARGTRFVA